MNPDTQGFMPESMRGRIVAAYTAEIRHELSESENPIQKVLLVPMHSDGVVYLEEIGPEEEGDSNNSTVVNRTTGSSSATALSLIHI